MEVQNSLVCPVNGLALAIANLQPKNFLFFFLN